MKMLFDFLPILLFFIAFKFYGIYVATSVAMAASVIQTTGYWVKYKRFENMHLITMSLVVTLGAATLFLHNPLFIKWKPTAIYWVFAVFFMGSQFIGKKTVIQRMMDNKIDLPDIVWQRLNLSWAVFFTLLGAANVYVVYHFSTNTWVNFKLFGTMGLTLAFIILQAIYMSRFVKQN